MLPFAMSPCACMTNTEPTRDKQSPPHELLRLLVDDHWCPAQQQSKARTIAAELPSLACQGHATAHSQHK